MLRKVRFHSFSLLLMQLVLCVFSAAMLFAAYPYLNQPYLAWFAFIPWITAVQDAPRGRAFALSYLTGLLFWGATVYWLIHVTLLGMVLAVMYLALYFAAFGFIVSTVRAQLSLARVLFIPSVWVLLEFLRSHLLTGFPWALAAYTQAPQLAVIQVADITGAWGISFLVLMVNVTVQGVIAVMSTHGRLRPAAPVLTSILFAACLWYGGYKLSEPVRTVPCKVAVVQGNVPHEEKWRPDTRDAVMTTHLALTEQAAASGADLIVWSEAALPVILEDEPRYFEQTKKAVAEEKMPLLVGSITNRNSAFFNSALLLLPSGEVTAIYDKIHLVPFGEYIPLRSVFPFLQTLAPIGELTKGTEYTVFHLKQGEATVDFSTLICFEDLFPEMSRKFVMSGASFLVNITNDAWYRYSPATYQHCQAAVLRAVENRVPVVRCANTGVSCFIDRTGKVSGILKGPKGQELFFPGYGEAVIAASSPASSPTVYNRFGDYFIWACWFFVFIGSVLYFMDRL